MTKTVKNLKDYQEPNFWVESINLVFNIKDDKSVEVTADTVYYKNPNTTNNDLVLDGNAQLVTLKLDNNNLSTDSYQLNNLGLSLTNLPEKFKLHIVTKLEPWNNKSCMGLYAANNNLLTQCEPEGFRTITYFLDRPDVLTIYTTTIICKDKLYTSLLSNGNKISDEIKISDNVPYRHVVWHDPFKKPSYLFALVASNLPKIEDSYTTKSGKPVKLEIYADADVINDCHHAMQSLKRSFKWDEDRFNLEYDLNNFMIVATNDFNMGAMENKSLNIFNAKYIVANKNTATDTDFLNVESVVAHEYFHNWTGNRITCRDWFQLSLKEGLTVFRDQEFTSDLHSRAVERIFEVKDLVQHQFPEDAGALSHPVRPESYLEINNFYTSTVYNKGAEVVRMYQTILGKKGFNQGLALYISRHDGSAATCEDFCQAMMDANDIDLKQFMLWYSQAGTPHLIIDSTYDSFNQEYHLNISQHLAATPNQPNKKPMLIPIQIGLLAASGHELIDIKPEQGRYIKHEEGIVLLVTDVSNKFVFKNIKQKPTPSILRNFSAPVKVDFKLSTNERFLLINHDNNEFNRYYQLQQIFQDKIVALYTKLQNKNSLIIDDNQFFATCKKLLDNPNLEPAFRAICFSLPSFSEMLTVIKNVEPQILSKAIDSIQQQLGTVLFDSWLEQYNLCLTSNNNYDFRYFGKRSLKNIALSYILSSLSTKLTNPHSLQLFETMALGQYHNSDNMTDSIAVISATNDISTPIREQLLETFYQKWHTHELVMDKWFAMQALSDLVTIDQLEKLMVNKAFIATNPNKIYSLLGAFTRNCNKFHSMDGYSFLTDKIIAIDKFNPSVASRLTSGFNSTVYLADTYKKLAKVCLNRILEQENISDAVYEIAQKINMGLKF
jgi:aminopeptidase N